MPIGFASLVAAGLLAAATLQPPTGQQVVRPGMSRAEVERRIGEPFNGYTRFGDPLANILYAHHRHPRLEVTYQHDIVTHVDPPYRPVVIARGGTSNGAP